jgi:cellulose synthase/poly-beta-1,6-N-acetylglucosamine synthase-like glycosyltransferase
MNEANDRYKRNLNSIFQQDYTNYKVFYVDDNSEDKTAQLVKDYVKRNKLYKKIKLYQNT